jgi:hypothetical protein
MQYIELKRVTLNSWQIGIAASASLPAITQNARCEE